MGIFIILKGGCRHFDEAEAKKAVSRICYTDRDGQKREGAHWTKEQVMDATNGMKFREGVTDWDKYVAFNAGYADFCRVLTDELVLRASHAFYFADEDAPEDKVFVYMRCMQQK